MLALNFNRSTNVAMEHNVLRICAVPMLKLTLNLIKWNKDGKFRNI